MSEFVDLSELSSRVSVLSLKMPSARTDEYQHTMDATECILDARDATGDDRASLLFDAAESMRQARAEIPDEYGDEWDELIDAVDGFKDQ